MSDYFAKFPVINYNGVNLRNITYNFDITDGLLDPTSAFLSYLIEYEQRPDAVAFNYYGSSEYYWILNRSNNIQDMYYDWVIPDSILQDILTLDYGSVADAENTTLYYLRQPTNSADPYTNIKVNPQTFLSNNSIGIWDAIDAFTAATQWNENRRTVFLINNNYTNQIENVVNELLSN